eukprot:TRINITY_DN4608_c0_g1_i1.p1 TRINITY_DN4608_c0_g1~~TRINITY_DN4608_c0_g1_i1.p1  ORF type:complete len:116 (+),score=9.53 TRINITY_DN4608_c0_g1_i1:212-559(+)
MPSWLLHLPISVLHVSLKEISSIHLAILEVCTILNVVSALGVDVYFVTIYAWLLLIVVLGFFVHILDNAIETIFVCFVIDKDKGKVCKWEIHEVYVYLPISRDDRYSSLPTRTFQ